MALYVNTNVSALNGQRNLANVTNRLNTSFERLSSGSRINTAKDDAAGLQISDRLTTQVTGLSQATRNANDGISIAQIAEGALAEITNNAQRMRQLTVQGGNTVLSSADRSALAQEFKKLLTVSDDIATRTAFGEQKLLDGSAPQVGFRIQTGAYEDEVDTVTTGNGTLQGLLARSVEDLPNASALAISGISDTTSSNYGALGELAAALAAVTTLTVTTAASALFLNAGDANMADFATDSDVTVNMDRLTEILESTGELTAIGATAVTTELSLMFTNAGLTEVGAAVSLGPDQMAIVRQFATDKLLSALSDVVASVGSIRATLGAEQNGMMSTIRNNQTAIVNVSDSRSRITDTDFAAETAELTRNQIIQQASNSILAQANQLPQAALQLLG